MLWWILGSICGVLTLLAIVGIVILAIRDSKRKNYVLENGDHTTAWLVQANNKLFQDGIMDLPALVLISPDEATAADEEFMTDLAERIMELKDTDPDDDDEAFVAKLVTDETYVEGKRDKLPRSFTDGRKVYLAHIYVYRDHLPLKKIGKRKIACAVIWDEPGTMICTRPVKPKRRDDDED